MYISEKNVEILGYVEDSYDGMPAFLLQMPDGLQYISCGCEFLENTLYNREYLILTYNCKDELNTLLESKSIEWDSLRNASHMFRGCKDLIDVNLDYSINKIENASHMFRGCKGLIRVSFGSSLTKNASWMLKGCTDLEEVKLEINQAEDVSCLLRDCTRLKEMQLGTLFKVVKAMCMLQRCTSLTKVDLELPKAINTHCILQGCTNLKEVNLRMRSSTNAYGALKDCTSLEDWCVQLADNRFFNTSIRPSEFI